MAGSPAADDRAAGDRAAGEGAPPNPAPVRIWLFAVAALVALMVLIGGATRLTDSGLSITEWKPVTGAIPPLSEAAWAAEFDKYKTIPEYRLVNRGMDLAAFKTIYWWEWGHRFLGRLIGLAFAVPFLVFLVTGHLRRRDIPLMAGLFVLGGLQGAVGWWMVASGLVNRVDVSQYRLAVHLTLACAIFAALLWAGATFRRGAGSRPGLPPGVRTGAALVLGLIFVQIFLGGLVAGLDAGMAYNTWPLMDGRLVPDGLAVMKPGWRNLFENALTVQFVHRMIAYAIAIAAAILVLAARRHGWTGAGRWLVWLAVAIAGQMALGVVTLVAQVPMALALAHQAGALGLLAVAVAGVIAARGAGGG